MGHPFARGDDAAIVAPIIEPDQQTSGDGPANIQAPTPTTVEPHAETAEIIRQVEYYFSDENLPSDAHLLSKTGLSGQGWVSINEILSWKKMRSFKPPSQVKASLCQSEKLEVWKNKMIRRKDPLRVPILAMPKEDPQKDRMQELVDKPWMTKALFKPTGFEKNFSEVITPKEHELDQKLFDPEECFTIRIENAVARYMSKRKMHQLPALVFSKFMIFGGFAAGDHQFSGGLTDEDFEEFDKEQIALMKSHFAVKEDVLDGLDPDSDGASGRYVVDFEGMAKSFLSSHFMAQFDWQEEETVAATANILTNFYNYLLHHNVCPEYKEQVQAARQVCEVAKEEFATLTKANKHLPGDFNIACSLIHDGMFAQIRPADPNADWVLEEDKVGFSDEEARMIFTAGVFAHHSDECLQKVQEGLAIGIAIPIVSKEDVGLEVIRVEDCSGSAKEFYHAEELQDTIIKPHGKLHCIRWELPNRPPKDAPAHILAAEKAKIGKPSTYIVDEETLKFCYPGLKIEGVVKELECGIWWIDSVQYVYPSFYTWTLNEPLLYFEKDGPPKKWMLRQNEKNQLQNGGGHSPMAEIEMENSKDVESTPVEEDNKHDSGDADESGKSNRDKSIGEHEGANAKQEDDKLSGMGTGDREQTDGTDDHELIKHSQAVEEDKDQD